MNPSKGGVCVYVYMVNCLPLRASPIPAVTKRIVGIFDVMAERENFVGSQKAGEDFFFLNIRTIPSPPSSLLVHVFSLLLLTALSLHSALHTDVSFLEASETRCLIEAPQVYGQGWVEATVNPTLCYQPRGSHNEADMRTQASTFTQIHMEINAHTHRFIIPEQKSGLDWSHFPTGLWQKEKLCLMDIIVKMLYGNCQEEPDQ